MNITGIEQRRLAILKEMARMRSMRPGNINQQRVKGTKAGKPVVRGPYPVLCWREGKRVLSERLTSPDELKRAREDIANRRRFRELCKEFEQLTRQLGELERAQAADVEALRKGLKSRSNRTRK